MSSQPLVSVLMTVYNREKYIAEAIESVLNSTYENFELIIVDDLSTDLSIPIAKKYESQDKRIKIYINEKNLGDYPNRNRAASYAKGKYIKYLDSDDILYPHGLKVMIDAMEKNPTAAIGLSFKSYKEIVQLPICWETQLIFLNHFFKRGILYIGPSGCIYLKSIFEKNNGFNPEYKVAADYEFNLRIASQYPIVLFQRDLFWWRQHDGQEFNVSNQNNEYVIQNYLITEKLVSTSKVDKYTKSIILENNKKLMGRRLLLKFIKSPFNSFSEIKNIITETSFPIVYFLKCLTRSKYAS